MTRNNLMLICLSAALAGCTTVTSYESRRDAGAAKPADHPIFLYPAEIPVPRPYEVLGSVEIRDTPLTMFGGSFEGEVAALRKRARQVGADAVRLTQVQPPDFLHAKYRVDADLIRFTDAWEKVPLTEAQLREHFQAKDATTDPIEGIWTGTDVMGSRIGIVQNAGRPGREFIAFVLQSANPAWQPGAKKMDLIRGERPGVYRGGYFLDDYRRLSIAFALRGPRTNAFVIQTDAESLPIVFSKE